LFDLLVLVLLLVAVSSCTYLVLHLMCSCFSQGEITVGKLAKLANGSASIKVIGFYFFLLSKG